jgi:hypothetical protein
LRFRSQFRCARRAGWQPPSGSFAFDASRLALKLARLKPRLGQPLKRR